MELDQNAPLGVGFIVFASMIKCRELKKKYWEFFRIQYICSRRNKGCHFQEEKTSTGLGLRSTT